MSELQQEIGTTKSDIDAVILQQKITDKKLSNMIKSQEDLKNELEKAKEQRETLSLEMVDLQLGKYLFIWRGQQVYQLFPIQLNPLLFYFNVSRIRRKKDKKNLTMGCHQTRLQHLQSKFGYTYKSSRGKGLSVCKNVLFYTQQNGEG